MIAKFFILSLFIAGAFGSKYLWKTSYQNGLCTTFIFLDCDDTCDNSVSAIKGAIAEADPEDVIAAVDVALGYLGLDHVSAEEALDWADNFDWCAEISAHPAGDAICAWVHNMIQEYGNE